MTTVIGRELGQALEGKVRRRANTTGKLKASAGRRARAVVSGAPEVMVKVTGYGKSLAHVKAHLVYISRNGKLEIETSQDQSVSGKRALIDLADDWGKPFDERRRWANQRDTAHIVFSMPEGTEANVVRSAVKQVAAHEFSPKHDFLMALHTDTPQPHCHVVVKYRGLDGQRLSTNRDDLHRWRESFATALRGHGVECEATPRIARGITQKREKAVIRHIKAGGDGREPRVAKVTALGVQEAVIELKLEAQGIALQERPWMAPIERAQARIRQLWLETAQTLGEGGASIPDLKPKEKQLVERTTNDTDTVRQRLGAARLQQSSSGQPQGRLRAEPHASLRELSARSVVLDTRSSEVLLQPHARDRVGGGQSRDQSSAELRRPGIGLAGIEQQGRDLTAATWTDAAKAQLATRIEKFVEAMPPVVTRRDALKAQLLERARTANADQQLAAPAKAPERKR